MVHTFERQLHVKREHFNAIFAKIENFEHGENVTTLWFIMYLKYVGKPGRSFDDFVVECGGRSQSTIREKIYKQR